MLYSPSCRYVVFEEVELKNLVYYLDCLSETSESKVMEEDSMRDDLHDIIRAWEGGDNE